MNKCGLTVTCPHPEFSLSFQRKFRQIGMLKYPIFVPISGPLLTFFILLFISFLVLSYLLFSIF